MLKHTNKPTTNSEEDKHYFTSRFYSNRFSLSYFHFDTSWLI
jgi:hypothetical protein